MAKPPAAGTAGLDLRPAPLRSVAVYVHVPFCSSRCNYCDFYFETTRSSRVIASTLDRILEEAEHFMDGMEHPKVTSLYFGGGTPSVVPPDLLDGFLGRLRSILGLPPERADDEIETTFEANPESTSGKLLEVLVRRGVNRVSLGVQSFDDRSLRALTRRADRASVLAALDAIRRARDGGVDLRVNVDLIAGIPGQTRAMVRRDVSEALRYGVDHFSVYSLTVEEHTPLRQAIDGGVRTLPPVSNQDDLWLTAQAAIVEQGFEWYEISNFAKPGCRSRHNLGYWRLDPYLGLGPGGVSTIPMLTGAARGVRRTPIRLTNPNLFVYGSRRDRSWHHRVEHLSASALLFEHFITGLRTSDGLSLARIERVFGMDLTHRWSAHLEQWRKEGVAGPAPLESAEPHLVLTNAGRLALDRRLLEIEGWIDELGELSEARWPDESAEGG